jgi:hypothetical protein
VVSVPLTRRPIPERLRLLAKSLEDVFDNGSQDIPTKIVAVIIGMLLIADELEGR